LEIVVRMLLPLMIPSLLWAAQPAQPARLVHDHYDRRLAPRLVPLLSEVIRFPTVAGNTKAWTDQKAWIKKLAGDLGFEVRDAGKVMEVDLPATGGQGRR
jgi:hypothetical protein